MERNKTIIIALGRVSLSVYASHLIFLWLLSPDFQGYGILRLASASIIALVAATLSGLCLIRLPFLKLVVR